jgi:AcrR family transcriptional regulator
MGAMSAPSPHPRPGARQLRSQEVVEAVVRAGRELLAEQGPESLTTQRIVERAGVSIGSLYRNFENKEAVLAAIRAPEPAGDATPLPLAIEEGPLHTALSAVVDLALARRWHGEPRARAEMQMRTLLERHAAIVRVRDLDHAAFLLVHGLSAIVERTGAECPERLEEPGFRLELVDLLSCYLTSEQSRL